MYTVFCFFLLKKKCENPLPCKGFSHFSTKNHSVFVILPFEILTNHKLRTSLILSNWALNNYLILHCLGQCVQLCNIQFSFGSHSQKIVYADLYYSFTPMASGSRELCSFRMKLSISNAQFPIQLAWQCLCVTQQLIHN